MNQIKSDFMMIVEFLFLTVGQDEFLVFIFILFPLV